MIRWRWFALVDLAGRTANGHVKNETVPHTGTLRTWVESGWFCLTDLARLSSAEVGIVLSCCARRLGDSTMNGARVVWQAGRRKCDILACWPSSLVVNTATRNLVVMGPTPSWVTTSAKRTLRSRVQFPEIPRPGNVWECAGQWFLPGRGCRRNV